MLLKAFARIKGVSPKELVAFFNFFDGEVNINSKVTPTMIAEGELKRGTVLNWI